MKKEPLIFLVTLVVLAGLWFLSQSKSDDTSSSGATRGGGRPTRGADAQAPVEAKRVPGRFLPGTEVTWSPNASNIFEAPTETKDLPPLDLAPPPFPRTPHPGPVLPIALNLKARTALRRVIVPTAQPAQGEAGNGSGGGAVASSAQPAATQPTSAGPLVPLGKELSAVDRIKLSLDAELKRAEEEAKAKQSDEDRKKALDKLVLVSTPTPLWGEMAAGKNENRFAIKLELERIRVDGGLTEPERNDRLKKLTILFREDKRGKLSKPTQYYGDLVQSITFADTPENRFRGGLAAMNEADKKDLGKQLELAKIVFEARLFKLASEHLLAMNKAGLKSPESLVMLADSQHELYDYNQELDVLRQAVADFPDSAPLLGRLGRLQGLLGMTEDARATFAAALAKNSNDAMAHAGMAAILLRSGDAARAVPHLKDALNLAGSDPMKVDATRLLLAEAYLGMGDYRNAHEMVDLILQRSNVTAPERQRIFERAFVLAAVAALGQGQLAEARTRAEEGAKRYPLSGQLSFLLGVVMIQQGELAPARGRLATAVELDPLLTGHAQVALAMVEEASAQDNQAVAAAEAGATLANPLASELKLPFGRALLHVGDLGRAREQLLAALDAEPASADALVALGDVAYSEKISYSDEGKRLDNLNEAIRFYDRAASLEPSFPQLAARRIVTQVRRRKLAEAEDLVAKTGAGDLKDPFLQAALAYFHYTKGNQAESLQLLQSLGEKDQGVLGAYAKDAHSKLEAHQKKSMWTDTFGRTGGGLGREWKREIGAGVTIALKDSTATFDGVQKGTSDQPTMIWQERAGDKFVGFSVELDLPVQPGVYAGTGLMVMNQTARPEKFPGFPSREGGLAPYTGLQVALSPDAKLVYRKLEKGKMSEWTPITTTSYAGGPVSIELRMADAREGIVEVLVNRESVLKQTFADLKRFKRSLELQIFCQAQIDRKVHFSADNVVIVTLKS